MTLGKNTEVFKLTTNILGDLYAWWKWAVDAEFWESFGIGGFR